MVKLQREENRLKASAFAGLALAFASIGDAFLYAFLPLNFHAVGIPVMWVGLMLSINRFIRILSNTWMVHAFSRYGLRSIMLVAVVLAITSTFGYGVATGILAWVLLRIMWGLAFSAMRIGTLGYALQHQKQGLALGVSRSLQEAGPMLSLLIGPIFLKHFDSATIFYLLALLSLPAFYFAWKLPVGDDRTMAMEGKRLLKWPSALNAMTLASAIAIDGIIVVVLGILFIHDREHISLMTATTLAAFYLGYRRVCLVAFSAAGGWIADKIGLDRLFNISMAFVILGLVAIVLGWIGTGAVTVFSFYSINSAITPGSASKNGSHALAAVAENATWRDIGAAAGTVLGGFLISSPYLSTVLIFAIFMMMLLLFAHMGTARKTLKLTYLWK